MAGRQQLLPFIAAILLFSSPSSLAQEPADVHFFAECRGDNGGCWVLDYYCRISEGACVPCPNEGVAVTEDDCILDNSQHASNWNNTSNSSTTLDVQSCVDSCIKPQARDDCSESHSCDERQSFCNYDAILTTITNYTEEDEMGELVLQQQEEEEQTGTCQPCYQDISECVQNPSIHNTFGQEECLLCDDRTCFPMHFTLVEETTSSDNTTTIINSMALRGSPPSVVHGPLVDCTNLIYEGQETCDTFSPQGAICLVNDKTRNTLYIDVIRKCEALGGIGVVFYGDYEPRTPNNQTWTGNTNFETADIPSVSISYNDAERLQQQIQLQQSSSSTGTTNPPWLSINVTNVGTACWKQQFCSDDIPCVGYNEGQYCDYKWGHGTEGFCRSCPTDDDGNPDPLGCFFNRQDVGRVTAQKAIESCARTCASELVFPECKFCPDDVTGVFDFTSAVNDNNKCHFCPNNDVLYPDKEFPLFGQGIYCWQVQKLFETARIDADSTNCQLALMMNYVCGCAGPGYAGASTNTKKALLAWLPRVMAILSLLGSSYIIYDAYKEDHQKVMNQLLIVLSVFDILGSTGYSLTTLPMPEDDPYGPFYGAHGNEGTCTAQAFLIQMGTISAYINVSLAVYYFLVITYGWQEERARSIRPFLFGVPLLVGFTFAFAGIPFYGSLVLWCNNTASYWPDIPVAVAIGLATMVMATMCFSVYQTEQRASKWRSGASRLPSRVFWQSFWYLMAFYVTWPVNLALQYSWASGSSFTRYGWTLAAATMVPLQGFWNFFVYIKPRYMNQAMQSIRRSLGPRTSLRTRATSSGFSGIWSKLWSGDHHKSNNSNGVNPPAIHFSGISDDADSNQRGTSSGDNENTVTTHDVSNNHKVSSAVEAAECDEEEAKVELE